MIKLKDLSNWQEAIDMPVCGEALEFLKWLPDECVNCIVCSPPYFNLRSYLNENDPDKKLEIGLEKTHQKYIKKLIDIFDEVKRVLKKEGTCFVNLGDSYGGSGGSHTNEKNPGISNSFIRSGNKNIIITTDNERMYGKSNFSRLKNKNTSKSLMLIPERFAIAMVDSGWILRNKLVWIKPNAMPESVQDRWKKAHEYIFFFTKSKKYYFDLDAIRTPHKQVSLDRAEYEQNRNALVSKPSSMGKKYKDHTRYLGMPARMVKLNPLGACPPDYLIVNTNCSENDGSDEHYATYPINLIAPLIRAGCPKDGIVYDPFLGSGTTAIAAKKLGRHFLGCDLNPDYCRIADLRLAQGIMEF